MHIEYILNCRLIVLLLIRRGLTKLNEQLLRLVKMMPEGDEWERDSLDSCREKNKKSREKPENGDCRESCYSNSDLP